MAAILPRPNIARLSSCLVALVAALGLAGACGGDPGTDDPNCEGAKCDDPGGRGTPHHLAVLDCDDKHDKALAEVGELAADLLTVETSYGNCLTLANDSVLPVIEENLQAADLPPRSREEIEGAFEEYRYASLCPDMEDSSELEGDELELMRARCETRRERSLATSIDALVEFEGERLPIVFDEEREVFTECYANYDEALAASETPLEAFEAERGLATCAGNRVAELADALFDAQCRANSCQDELLVRSFIEAGFDTAMSTSDRACGLLVDASVYLETSGPSALIDCRVQSYAELRVAVVEGLGL